MKASMIFISNDVIINSGVILAGVLVVLTQSKHPDLIVGSIVFLIVVRGSFQNIKTWKVMKPIKLKSTISCPECRFQKEETMPKDSCQFFYECEN